MRNGWRSGRGGVAALDRLAHRFSAFGGRNVRPLLHFFDIAGEHFVLDHLPDPARVIAGPQMEHPGLIVDAVAHLHEGLKVLGVQIEFALRPRRDQACASPDASPDTAGGGSVPTASAKALNTAPGWLPTAITTSTAESASRDTCLPVF